MARSKGTSLLNNRAWIEHRFGPEGWKRLLDATPPGDRQLLETAVAVGWYDLGVEIRMLDTIERTLFGGERAPFEQMGRWVAERDLGGIQRLFLRLANPAYVLKEVSMRHATCRGRGDGDCVFQGRWR